MRDLGFLPGGSSSNGYDINDGEIGDDNKKDGERSDSEENVQITGFADTASGWGHAFIYSNGSMRDLGTLPGGRASAGYAINRFGEVTGAADNSAGSTHAFLYDKDGMHDLGTLPGTSWSFGQGINRYGDVVGHVYTPPFEYRGFLYRDGIMQDLNDLVPLDSGWRVDKAQGINDRGEIIGTGERNGVSRQILLTPICNRDSHRGKKCDEQNGNKPIEFPNNGFRKRVPEKSPLG